MSAQTQSSYRLSGSPDLSQSAHLPPNIPPKYSLLTKVFSQAKAVRLPPQHPWGCAIDLLLGTALCQCLFSLLGKDQGDGRLCDQGALVGVL